MGRDKNHVCFICSSGGHLNQSLKLINDLPTGTFDITLITYENTFTENLGNSTKFEVLLFPQETSELAGNPTALFKHMLITSVETIKLLRKKDFDVIVSTGAEIAIPLMLLSQFTNSKFIYIESLSRINGLSQTGQLSIHFADQTLAQWEEIAEHYESVEFKGRIV